MLSKRVIFSSAFLSVAAACASGSAAAQTESELDAAHRAGAVNQRGIEAAAARDYNTARKDYREAVDLYRGLGAPFEAHLSIALFNLAEAVCGSGKWSESEKIFEESLALSRRALGAKHPRTIAGLNALGHVETMMGEPEAAEAHFTEALAAERELHARDIQLAYALAGFSSLRLRQGKPEEALPYADEALRVTIAAQSEEGWETALMYANVGRIHRAAGRPERALPLLRKARAIYERTGGSGDPRYATILSEEGLALMDEGKFGLANAGMKNSIALLEQCGGCGFELAVARNNLGLLRFQQKKYTEADDLLRKALEAEQIYSPADAAQILKTKSALDLVRSALR